MLDIKKCSELATVIGCGLLILIFGVAIFLKPQKSFSESENRMLERFPTPSVESVTNGRFFTDMGDFYKDQFPLRSEFLNAKASFERLLGKCENNGIMFASNGYLIALPDMSEKTLNANLCAIDHLKEQADANGIPLSVCVVPRAADVLSSELPRYYAVPTTHTPYTDATRELTEILKNAHASGEYIWYRTDHHWTTDGAYIAYAHLASDLGIEPYPKESFERAEVSHAFLGTSFSRSGLKKAQSDTVVLYRYENDTELLVYDHETKKEIPLYDLSMLEKKDKYLVFLGGNYSRLSISMPKADTPRPRLLLIKDSFANAAIPFLARHFDLDIIDPRYYTGDASELLASEKYDRALVLMGLGTLEETLFHLY